MDTIPTIIKAIAAPYGGLFTPVKVTITSTKKKGTPKECFKNAAKYVLDHSNATYCLGYFLMEGRIPIEHAWVHDGEEYFEVTILNNNETDEYYVFKEFDKKELLSILEFTKRVPPTVYEAFKYLRQKK